MTERLARFYPALLAIVTALVYLPSLSGGYLNWDDPWLIRDNPILARGDLGALRTIWLDLSRESRLVLGAEYLPIRDTELWLEARLFGLSPQLLRVTNLLIYLGAVFALRAALLRTLPSRLAAEAATAIFALHPVHVESVAWLAGRKDVLALLFVALALLVHAGSSARRAIWVPLLFALAHFSKSMTISAAGLLLAQDLLLRRKPELRIYLPALGVAIAALAIHVHVGGSVGMTEPPAGGSRFAQLATMGPVWLRYFAVSVWPGALSLVHDVPPRTSFDLAALAGYAAIAAWLALAVWAFRKRKQALPLAAFIWFFVPLVPVSQVLFPLQNQMADRYLFLSVTALGLFAAWAVIAAERLGLTLTVVTCALFAFGTAERSALFGDSAAVFAHATEKTTLSPMAPYQLAQALEERGDDARAIDAYDEALRRATPRREEAGRRATNNLAKLHARHGRLADAERVLASGRALWPDDPKLLGNLAEVVRRQGRHDEARALDAELAQRFPDYAARRVR